MVTGEPVKQCFELRTVTRRQAVIELLCLRQGHLCARQIATFDHIYCLQKPAQHKARINTGRLIKEFTRGNKIIVEQSCIQPVNIGFQCVLRLTVGFGQRQIFCDTFATFRNIQGIPNVFR